METGKGQDMKVSCKQNNRERNKIELVTRNLTKSFGELRALDEVSIEVKSCITLIIGPNGSGKTTLINVITGFLGADKGRILFGEKEVTNLPPHDIFKQGIVRTFQTSQPLLKLTVLENLLIAEANYGESIIQSFKRNWLAKEEALVKKALSTLSFLGIEHMWNEPAMNLSGGQLRLLEIGRALMCQAKLIIMDEPIAGIAPDLSHSILKKIRELSGRGISFLIVEHRLDLVLGYVDRVYVMAGGRIVAEGRGKEVLENPRVVEVYLGDQG
ncbi:ABC transporter ATP-binding protein [Methanosarcina hadiensis]|uniref:ABC transporter ATP-binding protein n=1 Tax=Methanosarcina hadiensis TaxID=3078083 RepID=UPI003977681F